MTGKRNVINLVKSKLVASTRFSSYWHITALVLMIFLLIVFLVLKYGSVVCYFYHLFFSLSNTFWIFSNIITACSGKWYILIIFWLLHSWVLQCSMTCISTDDLLQFNISIHHHLFLCFSVYDNSSVSSSEKCKPRKHTSSLPITEKICTEKLSFVKSFYPLIVFPVCWNLWPYFSCSSLDVPNSCIAIQLLLAQVTNHSKVWFIMYQYNSALSYR